MSHVRAARRIVLIASAGLGCRMLNPEFDAREQSQGDDASDTAVPLESDSASTVATVTGTSTTSVDDITGASVSSQADDPDATTQDDDSTGGPPPCAWTPWSTDNLSGYPLVRGDTFTMTPDDVTQAATAIVCDDPPYSLPFRISFEFAIDDEDGGGPYTTADGVVVFFAKNVEDYGPPPTGGARGFRLDGTGYGVHFAIYESRQIIVTDGDGNPLAQAVSPSPDLYSAGAWRTVDLSAWSDRIVVVYEGTTQIDLDLEVDELFTGLGFGAATGSADGEHRIRNIVITPL